jgi:hypothetical protein
MTASKDVRRLARDYLWLVAFAPLLGVFSFAYDGVFIGATWAREMRNLMIMSLLLVNTAQYHPIPKSLHRPSHRRHGRGDVEIRHCFQVLTRIILN